jgi:hypothetical protein
MFPLIVSTWPGPPCDLTKDKLAALYDAPIGTLTDRATGQTAFFPA